MRQPSSAFPSELGSIVKSVGAIYGSISAPTAKNSVSSANLRVVDVRVIDTKACPNPETMTTRSAGL
jgi:hypothetical protein